MTLNNERAQQLVRAAQAHATELGVRVAVAIVDPGGHLILVSRMDGASGLSAQIAIAKGAAAALLHRDGAAVAKIDATAPTAFATLNRLAGVPLFPGLGSLPIEESNVVLGAIGVSGAIAEQDLSCAETALTEAWPAAG